MNRPGNRRTFLKLLGAGAAAAALPWWARASSAGPTTVPRRLVLFFTGGSMRGLWNPVAPPGQPAPGEDAFELGELHQDLTDFKSDLVFLDGLDMRSADLDPSAARTPHTNGSTHALAAVSRAGADTPGGPSIDQLIAAAINATPQTWLRSLELVGSGFGYPHNYATAYGPGQLVPQIWDPRLAWARLVPPTDDGARTTSVLEFAQGQAKLLEKRLGSDDRARVEAHMDRVRDLEVRLGINLANKAPRPPASILDPIEGIDMNREAPPEVQAARYAITCEAHARLIAAAFAADLTRVVTLTLDPPPDPVIGYTPGAFGTVDAHDLAHKVAATNSSLYKDNKAAVQVIKNVHLDQAKRFAALLSTLAAVKEADGGTLLDHTAVLWCGEIAEGAHDLHDLPWILAGRCGGQLKTGRYLKFAKDAEGRGRPHNDLFVSLANAMGVPVATFGNPACCTGPIDALSG